MKNTASKLSANFIIAMIIAVSILAAAGAYIWRTQ